MQLKWAQKGFTIVELLVVIIVIAILAAITIVSYNGVQNRAKSVSGQTLATQVRDKVLLFEGLTSNFPTSLAQFDTLESTKLEPGTVLDVYAVGSSVNSATTYSDGKKVVYAADPGGGCIYWWDYVASTPGKKGIGFGAMSDTGCASAW